jgi:putative tryptophan/tyrosine transport system substrate-binding protein
MRGRDSVALVGCAAASPFAARAQQQDRISLIGRLGAYSLHAAEDDQFAARHSGLGYIEGKNLHMDSRFADGHMDRLSGLASEFVSLKAGVIASAEPAVYAAHNVTTTFPIAAATASDLAAVGLAASFADQVIE